jgi:hypothetical protein
VEEIAMLTADGWRSSSSCENSVCVQTKDGDNGTWMIRDSKNPGAGVLTFSPDEKTAFLAGVKAGEFD